MVVNAIPDQAAGAGAAFSYTFPASTFSDPDGDGLTYTAAKSDDTALPTWLAFDANARTFSGTPQSGNIGTLSVKVTADDGRSGTVSDTFDIEVVSVLVSISAPADADEGNAGSSANKYFTVTQSGTPSAQVTVRVCYSGTATLGTNADYRGLNAGAPHNNACTDVSLATSDRSVSSTFGIAIRGDATIEFHETVVATLSLVNPPADVTLGTSVATYTIRDDDSTNPPPVPSVPTGFTATAGDGEVTLAWNAFSSPFTRLQYQQKVDPGSYGSYMTIIGGADGATTSHTVTGLINGTTYTFQLVAETTNGQGNIASVPATATATPASASAPVISVSLPISEGESRSDDGEKEVEESEGGVGIGFSLAADRPLASDLMVCVRVTESGGDRVALGDDGIQAVNMPSSVTNGSGTHTLRWTNTATDDPDSSVLVEVVAPNTAGCSAGSASYTISSSDASDKLLIQDDEATTVSLTSTDPTMTEGDASDTAALTVELSRQLYKGEVIVVPLTLASAGARLPGTANHDFTVTVDGRSVALANALTANPSLTFTGNDNFTVQTAVVTLTPVANRDDGNTAHEMITATLATDSVLGATGTGTTVNGGVQRHASDYMASLTLADDEGGPPPVTCSAQNTIFSDTDLGRILETGETTYCVRLLTAPSGGDTTVTIGRDGGNRFAANFSPSTLTFTSSDYMTPQQVRVTGADEPNTHRNRPDMRLTHTANGGGYSSQNLGNVRVEVDDAPEVEVYWYIKGGAGGPRIQRPHTITSTPGLTAWQNAAPGDRISYAVRLSNRPAPGGTVTVTATVPSDKRNLVGLSLTEGGTAQDTVTVEFKDRSSDAGTGCSNSFGLNTHQYYDSNGYQRRVTGGGPSESHDATPDTPWECWRMIYVVRKDASRNIDDTCADITHRASGGGVRKVTVDTIRAHILNPGRNWPGSRGRASRCRNVNGNTVSAPATAAPTPTEAVANLQVTAVDDTSASVTWDAVEHATSYDVSWSAESSDALNASAGDLPGVTGTTATIQHDAPVAMTLTVTVTPEYVDKNGDTQQLASLAGTATLAVGPGSDALSASAQAAEASSCVSATLLTDVDSRIQAAGSPAGVERWTSVRAALTGQSNAIALTEVKTIYDRRTQNGWSTSQWTPVIEAMECLAKEPEEEPAAAQAEDEPAAPAITLAAGDGVTEGTAAGFTLQADPAPTTELAVTVTVTQTGAVADSSALGERTVTIPAGQAEAAFTVATQADETDEPAGAVTATVSDGDGYTVDDQGKSASVAVEDDDATALVLTAPAGDLPEASGTKTLTLTLGRALAGGESLAVPLAFAGTATLGADYTLAAPETAPAGVTYANLAGTDAKSPPTVTFAGAAGSNSASVATLLLATVADSAAEGERETVTVKPGTLVAAGLGGGATASGTAGFAILEPAPEIAIAAVAPSVVEGAGAAFTLTASRAPGADLTVRLAVSEEDGSDFVAAGKEGEATVTILKGETEAAFTVPTVNDSAAEPDGAVTATLAGDGEGGLVYTVAAAPDNAATVTVTDNDTPSAGPTFSVGDETANEDVGMMYFTVRLDRAVQKAVKVTIAARESNPVSARYGEDFQWWWPEGIALTFWPGQTEKKMPVYVYNDSHDEDPETFEVVLSSPTGGAVIADGLAIGTITNSDPMPAAFLSRFGRTVAQQALDGIESRITAERTPGTSATIAGQALALSAADHTDDSPLDDLLARPTDTDPFGHHPPQPLSMTAREALLASSFTTTGETATGSLAIWGRAARDSFDGQEGSFSLDGTATTAMLGADYSRDRWLIGLSLLQSSADGSYADTDVTPRPEGQACPPAEAGQTPCAGAIREGDGKVEASLTAIVPYASIQTSEWLRFWGALGHGSGEVTLTPETGGTLTADTSWQMAAAGLRAELAALGSGTLHLTSDVLWSRTRSDKTHELAASDATVTRLRAGLEASWQIGLASGAMLTPGLELGARHDGGDAEQGAGIEIGGSLAWQDPESGFAVDLSARKLIAHDDDDFEENGLAASFIFDPRPDSDRGLSVSLRQDAGKATGGVDALFMPQALERTDTGATATTAEAAYGLPALAGRFTIAPHARLRMDDHARDTTIGWRLTPERGAPDLSLGLEATRREHGTAAPVHGVGVGLTLRW